MNDEYDVEEKDSLESIGDTIQKQRARNKIKNHKPKIGKNNFTKTLPSNPPVAPKTNLSSQKDTGKDNDSLGFDGENSNSKIDVLGVASTGIQLFSKKTWLIILGASLGIFSLMFLILMLFLVENSSSFNYVSGNLYNNTEYQRLYQELESVSAEYQANYGVKIDKHLIIAVLTSYKDDSSYVEDSNSGFFDYLDDLSDKTKASAMIETLAKYQIKTVTNCEYDSSSMRKIANNDDSIGITNFWTSELSREKNYDCSGASGETTYELSTEIGSLNDENSGSIFYWNLIDEDFFKEYYPDYFGNLSGEVYEQKAHEAIEYMYLYAKTLKEYDTTTSSTNNRNIYWWPIGSRETTSTDEIIFANGEPIDFTVLNNYSSSGGLEITSSEEDISIIAVKGGIVVYPTSDEQIYFPNSSELDYENELGNYIIIEHSDGTYTYYAHLSPGSITVTAGTQVVQGQVIGKMGSSGATSNTKLRFEVRVGGMQVSNRVNPEEYVDINYPRYKGGEFSLTSTTLTKQEFVSLMNWYCISSGHKGFCENFSSNAEIVYDVSITNNVNPELVVVTAGTEQNWNKCAGLYNFWGIGISNGKSCNDGPKLTSLEAGIKSYAKTINSYLEGGSYAQAITNRYNERSKAGCNPDGHGLPGTLAGMQSIYSWIGNYRYNPGNWGLGGCVYLNKIYGKDYCDRVPTCTNQNSCPSASKTTTCEQNDYTAWQLEGKINLRQKIFGL